VRCRALAAPTTSAALATLATATATHPTATPTAAAFLSSCYLGGDKLEDCGMLTAGMLTQDFPLNNKPPRVVFVIGCVSCNKFSHFRHKSINGWVL
jgi:hypothetical protein